MLNACGMLDVSQKGNPLSWNGYRGDELVHYKLDRVVANHGWFRLFPQAYTVYLQRSGFDHTPMVTQCESEGPQKYISFRFDKRWDNKEGLKGKRLEDIREW